MASSKVHGYDPEVWEAGKAVIKALVECLNYLAMQDPSNSYKVLKHQLRKGSTSAELMLTDAAKELMNEPMRGVVELVEAERRQPCGDGYERPQSVH